MSLWFNFDARDNLCSDIYHKTVKCLSSKSKIVFHWTHLPILAYHYLGLPFFCAFGYVSGKLKCLSLWFQRCLIGNFIFQDELPAILMKFLSITWSKLQFIYFSISLRDKCHDYPIVIQINLTFISTPSTVRQNNTHFLSGDYNQQDKRPIP